MARDALVIGNAFGLEMEAGCPIVQDVKRRGSSGRKVKLPKPKISLS